MRWHLATCGRSPVGAAWISVFYSEYKHLTGPRRTEIGAVRRRYEAFVQELIRQGQAGGAFCPDRDPVVMATAVLTLLNSSTLWSANIHTETFSAAYAEFALAGLKCDHVHSGKRAASAATRSVTQRVSKRASSLTSS